MGFPGQKSGGTCCPVFGLLLLLVKLVKSHRIQASLQLFAKIGLPGGHRRHTDSVELTAISILAGTEHSPGTGENVKVHIPGPVSGEPGSKFVPLTPGPDHIPLTPETDEGRL
jgi:hypothetical protein